MTGQGEQIQNQEQLTNALTDITKTDSQFKDKFDENVVKEITDQVKKLDETKEAQKNRQFSISRIELTTLLQNVVQELNTNPLSDKNNQNKVESGAEASQVAMRLVNSMIIDEFESNTPENKDYDLIPEVEDLLNQVAKYKAPYITAEMRMGYVKAVTDYVLSEAAKQNTSDYLTVFNEAINFPDKIGKLEEWILKQPVFKDKYLENKDLYEAEQNPIVITAKANEKESIKNTLADSINNSLKNLLNQTTIDEKTMAQYIKLSSGFDDVTKGLMALGAGFYTDIQNQVKNIKNTASNLPTDDVEKKIQTYYQQISQQVINTYEASTDPNSTIQNAAETIKKNVIDFVKATPIATFFESVKSAVAGNPSPTPADPNALDTAIKGLGNPEAQKRLESRFADANKLTDEPEKQKALNKIQKQVVLHQESDKIIGELITKQDNLSNWLNEEMANRSDMKTPTDNEKAITDLSKIVEEKAEFVRQAVEKGEQLLDADSEDANAKPDKVFENIKKDIADNVEAKMAAIRPADSEKGWLDEIMEKKGPLAGIVKAIIEMIGPGLLAMGISFGAVSAKTLNKLGYKFEKVGGKWMENPKEQVKTTLADSLPGLPAIAWNEAIKIGDDQIKLGDLTIDQFNKAPEFKQSSTDPNALTTKHSGLGLIQQSLEKVSVNIPDAVKQKMNVLKFIQSQINLGNFNSEAHSNLFGKTE